MNFVSALYHALGSFGRRLLFRGIAVAAGYKFLRDVLNTKDIVSLPDLPWWIIVVGFPFLVMFVALWMYATRLGIPKIKLEGPFVATIPKGSNGRATRTYYVRIMNPSGVQVRDCAVKLARMVNRDGTETKEQNRPFKSHLENPNDILNANLTRSFDINPGDVLELDVVQYNEINPSPHIRMCYARQGHNDMNVWDAVPVSVCPHVITLRATAANSAAVERTFQFWI